MAETLALIIYVLTAFAPQVQQFFNVLALVKVLENQLSCKALIEYQAMIILVKSIHVDAHEAEEFGINELFASVDADLVRENLPEIHAHFFRLFIQREEHFSL